MIGPMRRRKFTVRAYRHPRLKFVVNHRENGKRKRSFFEMHDQANAFCSFKNAELKRYGIEGSEFSARLREMAQECAERLVPYGRTLADATDFFVAYLKASECSITAAALVPQYIAAKKADGASKRYVDDLRSRLNTFAEAFNEQMIATITSAQLDDWLRSLNLSPVSRNNFRRVVVTMFSYAVQRGYSTSNPAAKAAKAKVVSEAPGILTVTQSARLLEAASPELLPYFGIGLFAGLRRAEIERLDWSEIDFESGLIKVTAQNSKTAQRRFVTMQPNLREWLLPLRKHKGNVTPGENFRQSFDQARVAAGIEDWSNNALRHSFASYHLAHFKNAAATALELGHHDSRVTFAHYRELVKPKEGERYWNIRPAKVSRKIVQLAAT